MLARVIIVVILGDLIGETNELIKQVVVGGMQPRNRCPVEFDLSFTTKRSDL